MSYNVIPTATFKSHAKRLIKKYPSLKKELVELNTLLCLQPDLGTPLGNNTYKVRLAVKSKGKGKSGGMRIITFKIDRNKEVYMLTIYDKADMDTIDDKAIKFIIRQITV
jgi:mRNA-degrading endonuclease RelE of RelBE toxin-antitoxin system